MIDPPVGSLKRERVEAAWSATAGVAKVTD
jgi:hypothetical protein